MRKESSYQPGKRSAAWIKMRANGGQELIIGGYVPAPKNFDSIVVGYYEDKQLIHVARVRNGFTPGVQGGAIQAIPRTRSRELSVPKSP
jgi:bifunctional non-homologous end joining protein LigD